MLAAFFPAGTAKSSVSCGKCHVPSGGARPEQSWTFGGSGGRPFLRFSHAAHVRLSELSSCSSCHAWKDERSAAGSTIAFKPIAKETCMQCHAEGKVRSDCTLCHAYHRAPGSTDPVAAGPGF